MAARFPACARRAWLPVLVVTAAALAAVPGWGAAGGVQALVKGLDSYAETGDTADLRSRLHPALMDCVTDVEGNTIARFVLGRVRKQGVPETLETRRVEAGEVEQLEQQARQLGLAMPVPPTRELRLVYDDYTARFFMAEHDRKLRWVLPCAD